MYKGIQKNPISAVIVRKEIRSRRSIATLYEVLLFHHSRVLDSAVKHLCIALTQSSTGFCGWLVGAAVALRVAHCKTSSANLSIFAKYSSSRSCISRFSCQSYIGLCCLPTKPKAIPLQPSITETGLSRSKAIDCLEWRPIWKNGNTQ